LDGREIKKDVLLLRILNPFSNPEVSDFLFTIQPQDGGSFLKILKHIMGFREGEVLLAPLAQVTGECDDFHIISTGEQLFCLLAFDAVF
jgi:hypothetical protein